MKRILFIGLTLFSLGDSPVLAISSGKFLVLDPQARSGALGGILAEDGRLNKGSLVKFTHSNNFLLDTMFEYLSFKHHFPRWGTWGGNLIYNHQPDFESIDSDGESGGEGAIYDLAAGIDWTKEVEKDMKGGVELKWINSKLVRYEANTLAIGFSLVYNLPVEGLSVLAKIENLGRGLKYNTGYSASPDPLPTALKLGFFYYPVSSRLRDFTFTIKTGYYIYEGLDFGCGIEYSLNNQFFIRAGFRRFTSADLVGCMMGMGGRLLNFELDYALIPYINSGFNHIISLSHRF